MIGRRFVLYPQPERSEAEWEAWWADYTAPLKDLPLAALEHAMAAHVASPDAEFLPKPGKLRAVALSAKYPAAVAYARSARAVAIADQAAQRRREPPKLNTLPEGHKDREAVKTMMAEFRATMAARSVKEAAARPAIRPTHGKTDETGITPQLRALMGLDPSPEVVGQIPEGIAA